MNINEYLSGFFKGTKDPSLDAMQFFMEELSHPEEKLKIVHIAGTNGKGSVTEMLSTILEQAGYTVGEFMSPHIVEFNERIRINHKNISNENLEDLLKTMDPLVNKYNSSHKENVTLFELETAMALLYFAKNNCDIVVLETGLGGLYDCTNIVHPILSMITSIGYDHMDILGNTLEEIAIQKAGIIKENSQTIFVEQEEKINKIIRETCKKKNNVLHFINLKDLKNVKCSNKYQSFDYQDKKQIEINLKGRKQIQNASMVLEAINVLNKKGFVVKDEQMRAGLKKVIHKARFETIYNNPTIIFDGGHNEPAIKNLKETINQFYAKDKKIYILSILKTKDYKKVIKELMEDEDSIFIFTDGTKVQDEVKCYARKEDLYKEALKYRKEKIYMDTLENAIRKCKKEDNNKVIFIIGSFYTYQEVMETIKE